MKRKQYESPASETVGLKMKTTILQNSVIKTFWLGTEDAGADGLTDYTTIGDINW